MSLIVPWFTLMTTWWPQVHFHFHPLLHDSHVIFEGGEGCTPVHRHDRVHIEVPRLWGKDEGGGRGAAAHRVHQAHQLLRGLAQQQGVEEHREEDLAPRSFLRLLMFLVLAGALFFYMIYMLFVFFVFFCPL